MRLGPVERPIGQAQQAAGIGGLRQVGHARGGRHISDATAKRPDWFFNYYLCAACHSASGDLASARRNLQQAAAFGPYTLQALRLGHPFTDRKMLEQFVGHLRAAGWEDT